MEQKLRDFNQMCMTIMIFTILILLLLVFYLLGNFFDLTGIVTEHEYFTNVMHVIENRWDSTVPSVISLRILLEVGKKFLTIIALVNLFSIFKRLRKQFEPFSGEIVKRFGKMAVSLVSIFILLFIDVGLFDPDYGGNFDGETFLYFSFLALFVFGVYRIFDYEYYLRRTKNVQETYTKRIQ